MPFRIRVLLAVALPALLACASRTGTHGSAALPNQTLITRAELEELDVRNAYEAVQRLRPRWLIVRSGPRSFQMETEVVVFQDEMYLGNQDALERLGIEGIFQIKYLDGPTAKATLPEIGNRHVQGAIVVSMRPPAPQRDDQSSPAR